MARATSKIVCVECGRRWDDADERWQAHLMYDDQAVLYCPECAADEFGVEEE
jgi:uncharacterized Zn ribbon protein